MSVELLQTPIATYAPSGASSLLGTSFLDGNLVELGSNGIVAAVLLPVKESATCVSRVLTFDCISDILNSCDGLKLVLANEETVLKVRFHSLSFPALMINHRAGAGK